MSNFNELHMLKKLWTIYVVVNLASEEIFLISNNIEKKIHIKIAPEIMPIEFFQRILRYTAIYCYLFTNILH